MLAFVQQIDEDKQQDCDCKYHHRPMANTGGDASGIVMVASGFSPSIKVRSHLGCDSASIHTKKRTQTTRSKL